MELLVRTIQEVYIRSLHSSWKSFEKASRTPEKAQLDLLFNILSKNSSCEYGLKNAFESIKSVEEFQDKVPIQDYDSLESWVTKVANGNQKILTEDPVLMMEKSGGSTSTNKLIPYTKDLLNNFSAATNPWIYNLYTSFPKLMGTTSYWAISPVTRSGEKTNGGVPVGFEDDTEYFGPIVSWCIKKMMAVPSSVKRISDMDEWRKTTCKYLVKSDNLGLISVWSPSFLILIMEEIEKNLSNYLGFMSKSRAENVQNNMNHHGRLQGEWIWPQLQVVSTWADGVSSDFISQLKEFFPQTIIQPKGLLATEGVVSFPIVGVDGAALSINSHFFEFLDTENLEARPRLAHQLVKGKRYSPILTTGGGFYRYHLKDIIECVGHFNATPLVRFCGKQDRISDVCGEKINSSQVDTALAQLKENLNFAPDFCMLAPVWENEASKPYYALYVEANVDDDTLNNFADHIEGYLFTGHHYQYCRRLGQLGPIRPFRVIRGWETYEEVLIGEGQRAGDIKATHLDGRRFWHSKFNFDKERSL